MVDLVVFGSLCEHDSLKVVSVPGRRLASGSRGKWDSVRFRGGWGGALWYALSLVACSPLHYIELWENRPSWVVVAVQRLSSHYGDPIRMPP